MHSTYLQNEEFEETKNVIKYDDSTYEQKTVLLKFYA